MSEGGYLSEFMVGEIVDLIGFFDGTWSSTHFEYEIINDQIIRVDRRI